MKTMNKIKAILVDDEKACVDTLAIELEHYCPEIDVLCTCTSPEDALEKIAALNPDLVFLDIEMPWMNGFELLQQFDPIPFEVIFVTAYDQFALKAFQFSAVDYLLKPVNKDHLKSAVKKVTQRIEKSFSKDHLKVLLENIRNAEKPLPNIAIPSMSGVDFIAVADIIYCEADNNYTTIYMADGSKTVVSKALKIMESMLADHSFIRIHQSYVVNMLHVKKYIKTDGGSVIMSNGKELSVSRSRKDALLEYVKI